MSSPDLTTGGSLSLRSLAKRYGQVEALMNVSLEIEAGEFVTFLGPSGSGKSTTLNLIAGFQDLTSGEILMDGKPLQDVKPHKRELGIVFQNYALFPHMTAGENVAYPLRQRKVPKGKRIERVEEALASVGLADYANRYPRELSGGQQQRVAVARALVFQPRVLLMDEPLGALDKHLRQTLQLEIKRLHRQLGITFIYVTHDQEEALVMSDRIAVFNRGAIEQVGSPTDLYDKPATPFVAEFLGETNAIPGVIEADAEDVLVHSSGTCRTNPESSQGHGEATLFVRPEKVRMVTERKPVREDENCISGCVKETVYMGSFQKIIVAVEGSDVTVTVMEDTGAALPDIGSPITVAWQVPDSRVLVKPGTDAVGTSPTVDVELGV